MIRLFSTSLIKLRDSYLGKIRGLSGNKGPGKKDEKPGSKEKAKSSTKGGAADDSSSCVKQENTGPRCKGGKRKMKITLKTKKTSTKDTCKK